MKKRIVSLISALLLLVLPLPSCNAPDESNAPPDDAVLSDVQYFREGVGGGFDMPFRNVLLDTHAALDEYRAALGLENAYAEYDQAFFAEKNRLVLISLTVNTSAASYAFSELRFAEDNTTLIIVVTEVCEPNAKTAWRLLQFAVPLISSIPACGDIEVYHTHADTLPENATPLTPIVMSEIEEQNSYYLTSAQDAARFSEWFLSSYAQDSRAYYASLDDTFFEAHDLIVIPTAGGSSSIDFEVVDVIKEEDGSVTANVLILNPTGALNDDDVSTQIVIPVKKGLLSHPDSLYTQKVKVNYAPVSVSHDRVR